jgi:hypothetical protein
LQYISFFLFRHDKVFTRPFGFHRPPTLAFRRRFFYSLLLPRPLTLTIRQRFSTTFGFAIRGYPLKAGQFYQDSDVISGKTFSTQSIA